MKLRFGALAALISISLVILAAAIVTVVLSRRKPEPRNVAENVLAIVCDRQVTSGDLRAAVRTPAALTVDSIDELLEREMQRQAQVCAALELGLDQDPQTRRDLENVLIGRLRGTRLEPCLAEMTVSDDELSAAYSLRKRQYFVPARARIALLFLKKRSGTGKNVRRRMEEARARALSLPPETKGFGGLAVSHSEDQVSRYRGGDIGWLTAGQKHPKWPQELLTAAFELRSDAPIGAVIETENAVYLIKLIERRDESVRPMSEVAPALREELLNLKRKEAEETFVSEWFERFQPTIVEENLVRFKNSLPVARSDDIQPPEVPSHP